jgi:hypothetical protein
MRAGNYLAVMCLFFGAALAAFVSGSLEPRLGNLFVFGVMPAVGFSAGGYVLGHLLVFGVKAGDTIMVRCFQYVAQLANALINCACATVPNWVALNVHGKPNPAGLINGDELGLHMRRGWRFWPLITAAVSLTAVGLGCLVTTPSYWQLHSQHEAWTSAKAIHAMVEQIIGVESDRDPNAKNTRSSATGLGQFLDETWLYMISAHRPDLAKGRSQAEILELRRDARPMPPLLWRARTQRVERSAKRSSRQILSSKASRLLILGIGPSAKCAFLVGLCSWRVCWDRIIHAGRGTKETARLLKRAKKTQPRNAGWGCGGFATERDMLLAR